MAGGPGLRIWTTAICVSVLGKLDYNCLVPRRPGDFHATSDDPSGDDHTMTDLAYEWLLDAVLAHPVLKGRLPSILELAARQAMTWDMAHNSRVSGLREAIKGDAIMKGIFTLKAGGTVLHAFWTQHKTASTFMRPFVNGLRRWQQWMVRAPPCRENAHRAPQS